jgi:hypothetical protein
MANETNPMGKAVEQSMGQAQKTLDQYFQMTEKAFAMNPWTGTDFANTLQRFYAQNMQASLEHVQRLSQTRDLQEAIALQTEYLQKQMQSVVQQFQTLGEAFIKSAQGGLKGRIGS